MKRNANKGEMDENIKHFVFGVCIAFMMLGAFAGAGVALASATTWRVDDDLTDYPDANFTSIQDAVDAASPGDTIIVYPGTYTENVDVNKDHLTIKSEGGAEATIVQAADSNYPVFEVTADYVNISGFMVKGAGGAHAAGLYLSGVGHSISDNSALNNWCGIDLDDSHSNNITNNSVSNNDFGICLYSSSNNTITNNNASSNNGYGIFLDFSSNITLTNNIISGNRYNFGVTGYSLSHFIHNIDTSNKVDGKTIYYWVNQQNTQVPSDAGYIGVVNSKNITLRDLILTNNGQGVLFAYTENSRIENVTVLSNEYGINLDHSSNNTITNNNASNNRGGIYLGSSSSNTITNNNVSNNTYDIWLYYSSNNTITNNNVSNNGYGIYLYYSSNNTITNNNASNNYRGIYLWDSNNNEIFLNNFINNTYNVHSYNSANTWNSTEKITYTYNGSEFENYLGNYWDDYEGNDTDVDGIVDTPYSIDSDKDNYPLMEPFEIYLAPTENIFDTGASANPYPSISGTHNGTITPNQTIIATKLYTYPCEGTGGHIEYVRIYNESGTIAEANWTGYKGDWHNITFDKPVVLLPNKTYNYTIRTGSYPQIHHNRTLTVPDGEITCTKFTDANGKVYYDWIPTIKLW